MAKKENIKKLERSLAPGRELIVYSFRFVIGRRICTTDRETGDQTPLPGTLVFLSTSLFPYNCNLICFFFSVFYTSVGCVYPAGVEARRQIIDSTWKESKLRDAMETPKGEGSWKRGVPRESRWQNSANVREMWIAWREYDDTLNGELG
jgi:hypothetical protein